MSERITSWRLSRRTFLKASAAAGAALTLGCRAARSSGPRVALRIGLLTDTHYADRRPNGTRYYRESMDKVAECIDRLNLEKVDFAVHIGDFKDEDPEPVEAQTLQYVSDMEAVYARFRGPRYHVLGNHDIDSISKEQFLARVENTGVAPERSYYSFDRNGFHFIVLDACFRQDGAPYDKGNFDWKDTYIPTTQLDWLRADLQTARGPVIVFVHQLLDPEQTEVHQIKNAAQVRSILEQSEKVLAVFQGHQHEGGYHLVNGIHYYTLIAMVEGSGAENNSYAILDVHENGDLVVNGYRRTEDRILDLDL